MPKGLKSLNEARAIIRRARRLLNTERQVFLESNTVGCTGKRADLDRDQDRSHLEELDALHADLGKVLRWI